MLEGSGIPKALWHVLALSQVPIVIGARNKLAGSALCGCSMGLNHGSVTCVFHNAQVAGYLFLFSLVGSPAMWLACMNAFGFSHEEIRSGCYLRMDYSILTYSGEKGGMYCVSALLFCICMFDDLMLLGQGICFPLATSLSGSFGFIALKEKVAPGSARRLCNRLFLCVKKMTWLLRSVCANRGITGTP